MAPDSNASDDWPPGWRKMLFRVWTLPREHGPWFSEPTDLATAREAIHDLPLDSLANESRVRDWLLRHGATEHDADVFIELAREVGRLL